ncbi:MAG: hypothetical protein ACK559_31765, partial [bacterium]
MTFTHDTSTLKEPPPLSPDAPMDRRRAPGRLSPRPSSRRHGHRLRLPTPDANPAANPHPVHRPMTYCPDPRPLSPPEFPENVPEPHPLWHFLS